MTPTARELAISQIETLRDVVQPNRLYRLAEMRGNLNLFRVPDPDAYERANYMLMLQSWRE